MISNTYFPKAKRKATIAITAMAPLLLISGCVVNTEGAPQENGAISTPSPTPTNQERSENNESLASTISSSTDLGKDFKIEVYSLEIVGEKLLRLQIKVTNSSSETFSLMSGLGEIEDPYTAGNITLVDATNQTRYMSYKQLNGKCFCSALNGPLNPGESANMWVIFPTPPEDIKSMTVITPLTPPLLDIPISKSTETVENKGLAGPEVIPLTLISDNIEDQTGRTENGEEVSIILSSDVLFETNSSDLSDKAKEIIEQVATEIDSASSKSVSIDGYADNTGSESINLPLSEERAKSVEEALLGMISREGISFEVAGHGSSDPIANNDTAAGRERNRRVSVTFEK